MTDSVFSVDTMINLVQKMRQEKAECEDVISQTKHKARVLERRVEEVARSGHHFTMEEKVASIEREGGGQAEDVQPGEAEGRHDSGHCEGLYGESGGGGRGEV